MFLLRRLVLSNLRWNSLVLICVIRLHEVELGSQVFMDLGVLSKVPPPPFLYLLFFFPQCLVSWVCLKRVIALRFKIYSSSYSKSFIIKV